MSSAYTKTYTHIADIDHFFEYDEKTHSLRFIGDHLEVRLLKRFELYGLLSIADTTEVIGVMDLIINDTYRSSLHLLTKFTTQPTEVGPVLTVNGVDYAVLHYTHGDLFVVNTQVIRDKSIVHAIYTEFLIKGHVPYNYEYNDIARLLDTAKSLCDAKIRVDRVVFEMIYSHLGRVSDRLTEFYRHSPMTEPATFIALRSITYAPTSTTARVLGPYFEDGLMTSITTQSNTPNVLEDLLRGRSPDEILSRVQIRDPTD